MTSPAPDTPENKDNTPEVKEKPLRLWHKPFTVTFIILVVAIAGFIIYYFQTSAAMTRQNDSITTMETLIESKNAEIKSLQGKVTAHEYVIEMMKSTITDTYFLTVVVGPAGSTAVSEASPDIIAFGEVFPGGEASRTITITERFNKETAVSLNILGALNGFITLEPGNSMELTPGESRDLTLRLNLPENAPPGLKLTGALFVMYAPGCHT